MANVQRLTKRVNELEEWVKENDMTGGPQGTLEVFNYLVMEARGNAQRLAQMDQTFQQLRQFTFEFIKECKLEEEWDEFIREKENAVQEQTTEEIPALTEAEDGEEVGEEDSERKKPSKKSKKAKK